MTKKELVATIAQYEEIGNSEAIRVLDGLIQAISDGLARDGKVLLPGFGTFTVQRRPARKGHHPGTGEVIDIPEKNVVKFSAGKQLKETVGDEGTI